MKKHTQNNFLAYMLILVSFFILIFFTTKIYEEIQIKKDTLEEQNTNIERSKIELTRLKNLQQELLSLDSDADKEIKGFSGDFNDENITNHIYGYAQKTNLGDERIIIREMNITAGKKSDSGFNRADVNLQIVTTSQDALFGFINYLTDQESMYRFYITNFDYEFTEDSSNIAVTIPLILYYK